MASLLNRFLGMYIKNFDPKQLQVGIWNGEVTLKNLELRREALDQLKLPINVIEGHVGNLHLVLPLSNPRGKPVKVDIDEVFLLAAPKEDAEWNEEDEKKRAQAVKMEKLNNVELLKERASSGLSPEEQSKNQSFLDSLITAVVDNLQISIKNIHIRYEDSIATPGHPFSLGITLAEFSAVSTDENWKPTFVQSSSITTHKLATLGSLAVYWNTDAELFGTGKGTETGSEAKVTDSVALLGKFREMLQDEGNSQYMLKPVSGRAAIEVDKTGKIENPKLKARLLFQEFAFVLDDDQYRDALMLVDLFHYFRRHQEYKKYRPAKSPKEDPRAWLRFAAEAVLRNIHERNRTWSWDYMKERKEQRDKYIDLYKKKKADQALAATEQTELEELEAKLTYEDLRFYRSLGRSQLRKENIGVKKEQPEKQTWGQWIWGSGKSSQEQDHAAEVAPEISDEERKKLYDAIDWDEKKAISEAIDVPRESIKLQIESSLQTGSFTLRRDPNGTAAEILSLVFDNFQAKALQRPDSFLADVKLGGLRVYDGTTDGTLFPQIVKVKGKESSPKQTSKGLDIAEDRTLLGKDGKLSENEDDALFHLMVESNPLDESANTKVDLKLKAVELIYNPHFVVDIARFFRPPERHMESIGALMETAGATVEGLRQQTRAGLEFALQEHKTVNAKLDIQAPLIIVPESVVKKSTLCLILDAGHVALSSELVDKKTMQEIQSKQKTQYSETDFKRLETLMYDKFLIKLQSTQLLIGPGIEATKSQLESDERSNNYHIVDRINIDFILEQSIVPRSSDLTKTRISGHMEQLHASISDKKYQSLMRLIDIAIPKFDDDQNTPDKDLTAVENNVQKPSTRSRSKSFQVEQAQRAIVVDEDTDDENERSKASSQLEKTPSVNIHQRNFEFKFTVNQLRGSLYRSGSQGEKADQLLVELIADRFELDFYSRPFDMVAEVSLGSLSVDDYIEKDPSPEFKSIITSQDADNKGGKDLFHLKFIRVNRDSPEFLSTHEGIAMNLDVAISTINLIVTRKTLLTLLDFVLDTFTSPGNIQDANVIEDKPMTDSVPSSAEVKGNQGQQESDKIRIKVDLKSIALILNNDGIRLATLRLNTADIGVFLVNGCLRIDARLGSLSLQDDVNQGAEEQSPLRQLIAIEGENLADFKYQTFDSKAESYPGYDSKVYLRSGSIKVNFLEEPFRKMIQFLVKFGKMQAIYNAARQAAANQAGQMQDSASKILFDVLIKTPIIVFPRAMVPGRERDTLIAHLGEIYASNSFTTVKSTKKDATANRLTAGIRNTKLTSTFHFDGGKSEKLEMIDKVDLDFKIKYIEHEPGLQRPDLEIQGSMSPMSLRVSQSQLKFLIELSRTVPAAFTADSESEEQQALREIPTSTTVKAKQIGDAGMTIDKANNEAQTLDQAPQQAHSEETWAKIDLVFKADLVALELMLSKDEVPITDVEAASLSKFSINGTNFKLKMMSDGAIDSELLVHSFTISDSRDKDNNKYRKIMSLINDSVKQQLMAQISISGGSERHMIAQASIDSPRIIFAVDYLAVLTSFANGAFGTDETEEHLGEEDDEIEGDDHDDIKSELSTSIPSTPVSTSTGLESQQGMSISFRINIEDAQIMLIANPTISNSEAIVLGTQKVLLAKQNSITLQVSKVGMFLCRMDRFETSRLRILDDFSGTLSMESRSQGKSSTFTSIHVDVEPLVLRLSLRDILLAQQILNKVAEINADSQEKVEESEAKKLREIKGDEGRFIRPNTTRRTSSFVANRSSVSKATRGQDVQHRSIIMKREEANVDVQGIRIVLIGDLHELPLIDWSLQKFSIDVRDWSGALTGDTKINTYLNVFNFSKSAWEPLIEPWSLGFHVVKEQNPERLGIEIFSHRNMDLTLTSATIALASKTSQFLSTDEDVLSKPRGTDAPYRIRNYTGFSLDIWSANGEADHGSAAKLEDGEDTEWRFEDPTSMRENLTPEGRTGVVGIKLEGSGFDTIEKILVNREGETLYNLRPRQEKIQHRLLVEVTLGEDSVKYITFRSPLLVENKTQIPVELGVFNPEEGQLLKIEKIPPGEGRPAPVGAVFKHSLVIRPDPGFGYAWSSERLFWKDLLKRPVRTIKCRGESNDESPPFFFQMSANYDKKDPMTNVYPFMRICLSSPLEIQNLLPYDFKYQIYDQNTKKDWTNFLRKGGVSPVHVVELSHTLLLSVNLQDTPFKPSEYFFINTSSKDDYKRDEIITVKDAQGIQLNLKLHFYQIPDSGGAFKVSIYSPYVVLNKTGMDMMIQSKTTYSSARSAAGQGLRTESDMESRKADPYMFSYPHDDRKNRALLKIGESGWSKPQSFDAIGSTTDAVLPGANPKSEMHVGISVAEGEGKYKLSKVVTVTPRFILKNKLSEDIQVREPGSSGIMTIGSLQLLPLKYIRASSEKQLCLSFPGLNNQWSFPFNIDNVGTIYVKLAKYRERQNLIKVEIILEDATLFLHLSYETKQWPFEVRNESNMEFMFYQVNPNIYEDDEDRSTGWKPIRYKLPRRSVMPYSWDYPASKNKEIVLVCNGKERRVKLAEIGPQIPFRVPTDQGSGQKKVVEVNVIAQGPKQTLALSDYRPSKSIYKQKSTGSNGRADSGFEAKDIDAAVTFRAQLRFAGISISLINKHMKELLYLTLRELELKYTESSVYQTLRAQIKWIQIDNMLYGGIFPIILYPTVVPKTGKEMEAHPILQSSITRVKDDTYGVLYIKYASLLLQELTVEIDEDFIFSMLDFLKIPGASWTEEGEGKLCDEELDIPEPKTDHQAQDVYFEILHLHPMQINISFVRTERINAEDTLSSSNPLMFFVNIMTMSLGNVNDAPLRFNALMLENARVSVNSLIDNIRSHYTQEALRQVHVVLGSADFLGNPVGLFNNISSGVADIFYEPYQGLVMTDRPQDLGIGIAKGASSFVKRTVFGVSDSMAKFTGSMSKGLAAATLDKEFQDQRRMSRNRNRPKHALYGITAGGNAFANSMASGIGGLARHPLEGAEKEGAAGFMKGIGKGLLGVVTKPAIGAFDLASSKS